MADYIEHQRLRDLADDRAVHKNIRRLIGVDTYFNGMLASCRKRRQTAIINAQRLMDCA